jgi:hypothetical protein
MMTNEHRAELGKIRDELSRLANELKPLAHKAFIAGYAASTRANYSASETAIAQRDDAYLNGALRRMVGAVSSIADVAQGGNPLAHNMTDDERYNGQYPWACIDDLEIVARLILRLKRFERDLQAYIDEIRTAQTLAGDIEAKRIERCTFLSDAVLHIEEALRLISMVEL